MLRRKIMEEWRGKIYKELFGINDNYIVHVKAVGGHGRRTVHYIGVYQVKVEAEEVYRGISLENPENCGLGEADISDLIIINRGPLNYPVETMNRREIAQALRKLLSKGKRTHRARYRQVV